MSPASSRVLLAEPSPPTAVWLYVEPDGTVVYECGRCLAWWFAASDVEPLDDELACRGCDLERYGRERGVRAVAPPVNPDRTPADWLAEQGI